LTKNDNKGGGSGGKKKGGSKKKGGGKNTGSSTSSSSSSNQRVGELVVDYRYLAFDYHRAMLAGMSLLYSSLRQARLNGERMKALVIGLGGGALPLFIRRYFPPVDVHVVELDGSVVEVAKRCFGFAEEEGGEGEEKRLRVTVGDGLEVVKFEAGAGVGYDVIIVDVDNKDTSQGMSCPSPAFLAPSFLNNCRCLLSRSTHDAGMMVVNLAARSMSMLGISLLAFESIFTSTSTAAGGDEVVVQSEDGPLLYELVPSEQDVNRVLFGLTRPRVASSKRSSLGLLMERWIEDSKVINPGKGGGVALVEDPLELSDIASKIAPRKK